MKIAYFLITIICVTNTNSIDGIMLYDGEQHLQRLLQKVTKIPTPPKELRKELRNRYHTKGVKNQKSASIPSHK